MSEKQNTQPTTTEWTDGTDVVEATEPEQSWTTHQATRLVNRALAEAGLDKAIPPQMLYNYTTARLRAGTKPMIVSRRERVGDKDVTLIDDSDLRAWMATYIPKAVLLATLK